MSLRLRLTLWNVGALAVTLVLLGGILREIVARQTLAQIDRELVRRGQFVQENFGQGPPRTPAPAGFDGLPFLQIYDRAGLSRARNLPAPDPDSVARALRDGSPNFSQTASQRLYTIPLTASRGNLAFQTGFPLVRLEQQIRAATRALVTLIPFALVLVTGLSYLLTDRTLRPIEEAFERQKRFTADASHELRTPLSIVKAAAELGRGSPGADDEARALFARIERTADRTTRLVESLLLLARSDSGTLSLHLEPIPLPALLAECTAEARLLFPEGARIAIEECPEIFVADRLLLTQLVQNLLSNALRHTPPEGGVTLSATANALTVRDTGKGVPPEHLARLTERFYRADGARGRRSGGVGLGLAICRAIVQAHGGALHLASEPGRGTTVTATFSHS